MEGGKLIGFHSTGVIAILASLDSRSHAEAQRRRSEYIVGRRRLFFFLCAFAPLRETVLAFGEDQIIPSDTVAD
jgi:hypothetical protein